MRVLDRLVGPVRIAPFRFGIVGEFRPISFRDVRSTWLEAYSVQIGKEGLNLLVCQVGPFVVDEVTGVRDGVKPVIGEILVEPFAHSDLTIGSSSPQRIRVGISIGSIEAAPSRISRFRSSSAAAYQLKPPWRLPG